MLCVNRNHPEFKKLASDNNINIDALEIITHKYWLATGDVYHYPSRLYIQAQIGNIPYVEKVPEIRKLWEERYSYPQTFSSVKSVLEAKAEALKYFPSNAIVWYKDNNGNYKLVIRKPVAYQSHTTDDFFSQDLSPAQSRNLHIDVNQLYGVDKLKEIFDTFNTDRTNKSLADKVFSLAKQLGISVRFSDDLKSGVVGITYQDGTITFRKSILEREYKNDAKAYTILHELIHATTMYALSENMKYLPPQLQGFKDEITSIYNDVKNNAALRGQYGLKGTKEFVAELSNPVFREKLRSIDNRSWWKRIIDSIASFFGFKPNSTYYSRVINALDKAIDSFDLNTYLEYTGLKDALRSYYKTHMIEQQAASEDVLRSAFRQAVKEWQNKLSSGATARYNSFADFLSDGQLHSAFLGVQQEYAELSAVQQEYEWDKSPSEKKGTSKYSFELNGTVINTPFELNEQQKNAVRELDNFVHFSKDNTFTLSGYAGTGKTSIMEILADKWKNQGMINVYFTATTNKAVEVLEGKVGKLGYNVETMYKLFNVQIEEENNQDSFDVRNKKRTYNNDNKIAPGSVIIIDEASMIPEDSYEVITNEAKKKNLKVIYVGDPAQLPPVKSDKLSPVFTNNNGKIITLSKVERTGDNAVLNEATNIRNNLGFSFESSFNQKGEGVAYVKKSNEAEIEKIIEKFASLMDEDQSFFKILTYTNSNVAYYNELARKILGHNSATPEVGEPIMMNVNIKTDWRDRKPTLVNSGIYTVSHVLPKQKTTLVDEFTEKSYDVTISGVALTGNGINGEYPLHFINIKGEENKANRDAVYEIAKSIDTLYKRNKKSYDQREFIKRKGMESLLIINEDVVIDGKTKVGRTFDFGYAMTIHKSQGSTFNNILLDTSGVNMNNVVSKGQNQQGQANQDKQLMYVGVTRASDTVTVVTNHTIKKEDSPLNHSMLQQPNIDSNSKQQFNNRVDTNTTSLESNTQRQQQSTQIDQQQQSDQTINIDNVYSTIDSEYRDSKQSSDGVVIDPNIRSSYKDWQRANPDGIVAYRINWSKYNTPEEALAGRIGNPFSEQNRGSDTVKQFLNWIITGENYGNPKATEEYRQAIIERLRLTPTPNILYYKELGRPSHATVLNYLVRHKELLPAPSEELVDKINNKINSIDAAIDSSEKSLPSNSGGYSYDRYGGYEVSTKGDKRFSALNAKLATGTTITIDGKSYDVGNMTIENAYQSVLKKSGKGKAPATDSPLYNENLKTDEERQDYSYQRGYLPLWKEWAKQNPDLITELNRIAFNNRKLSDAFANTKVSQARALADILNEKNDKEINDFLIQSRTKRDALQSQLTFLEQQDKGLKVNDDPENFNDQKKSVEIISSDKTILSNEELAVWNKDGIGPKPRILVASEHTDPAFHTKEIIEVLEGKRKIKDWSGKEFTGHDFAGLYIITKHDGLPIKQLLETKIPKLIHFSITTLGNTEYEPGVMKYNDLLNKIEDYIKQGLNPEWITVRIDPIVPGITKKEDIEAVVKRASEMGIKRIRFSVMDAYSNTVAAMEKLGYDFNQYYGASTKQGQKYNFFAQKSYIDDICNFMLSLKDKYGITLGSCAEAIGREGISQEGCLSVGMVNKMLGTQVEDKGKDNNKQRALCSCYGGKTDALAYNNACASHCVYCYAKHENQIAMQYYNADGTLKDNNFTRTRENNPSQQANNTPQTPTFAINLPNYRLFSNLSETPLVDAKWKIHLLSDLDLKLSDRNSRAKNQEIIAKMNDILRATSEDDVKEISSARQKQIDRDLDNQERINTQMRHYIEGFWENELGSWTAQDLGITMSSSEQRYISQNLAYLISDLITEIQSDTSKVEEYFPDLSFNEHVDFSSMSRKEIVDTIGMDNVVNYVISKAGYLTHKMDTSDDNTSKIVLARQNPIAAMLLAADTLSFVEGFSISLNFDNGSIRTSEESKDLDPDNLDSYNDPVSIEEREGSSQEHWQTESRTVDILNSMSALVRQHIASYYQLNEDGSIHINADYGWPEHVAPADFTRKILSWGRGSKSLSDLTERLKTRQSSYPWLSKLISELSDTSGKYADFQSQFFSVFAKDFQLYSSVTKEDGVLVPYTLNDRPALRRIFNSIKFKFDSGQSPLINDFGKVSAKYLGEKNSDALKEGRVTIYGAYNYLGRIKNAHHADVVFADTETNEIASILTDVAHILGFDEATKDIIAQTITKENVDKYYSALKQMADKLSGWTTKSGYKPLQYGTEDNIVNAVRSFLTPITDIFESDEMGPVYNSGKTYQPFVTPSFITRLINKFTILKGKDFYKFLDEEYGVSEFFTSTNKRGDRKYRLRLLRELANPTSPVHKNLAHKVELDFNGHNYMRNMSPEEYTLSVLTEFFSEGWHNRESFAWYRMPIPSNKPSAEYLRLPAYRDSAYGEYKDAITDQLSEVLLQELSRIKTVRMRNLKKGDSGFIKNFDTRGRSFCILPFMNPYLENTESSKRNRVLLQTTEENNRLAILLQKAVDEKATLSNEEIAELNNLSSEAIKSEMTHYANKVLSEWAKDGILSAAANIAEVVENPAKLKEEFNKESGYLNSKTLRESLENFLWNDRLANILITELVIGDTAFYADAEDLQKRLSEYHAPGLRGNVEATDYNGNRVSDGVYRTIILKDFDSFISNVIDNISEVFDRMIARSPQDQRDMLLALKDSLVGKGGAYRQINVADAQGYSSPSSYRKKALMFGKWSQNKEAIWESLVKNMGAVLNGKYTMAQIQAAFQPMKPFVFSHLTKVMQSDAAPIQTMRVPFQAKNSETLLILADALIESEKDVSGDFNRPNLLRVIYRVMEESERQMPTKGIDTVQFESAIKSGLQGALDLNQFLDKEDGEKLAYNYLRENIYHKNEDGKLVAAYNTETTVHELPYEDYSIQQEIPSHYQDHAQQQGSQERMIIPSDLEFYKDPNLEGDALNTEDNINYYEWTDSGGTHHKLNAKEFRQEYEATVAQRINDSVDLLREELHLNSESKLERNLALSKILQREILSSPRYSIDLFLACTVNRQTGNFNVPMSDPIQASRFEQLVNSIIRNRINKQPIAGGPLVQASSYGLSKQLNIRFFDKQGGILKTKDEFSQDKELSSKYSSYKDYVHENQAGEAYMECILPAWSKEAMNAFMDENGNIDMTAIKNCNPQLLDAISYRIPTEAQYSITAMRCVGFAPSWMGDVAMFPADLTTVDDSDFDIDKRYVMRKALTIVRKPKKELRSILYEKLLDDYEKKNIKLKHDNKIKLNEDINMFLENSGYWSANDEVLRNLPKYMRRYGYTTVERPSDRLANKIIDMSMAVLRNPLSADKMLNPGGFEPLARTGYKIAAYMSPNNNSSWSQLDSFSESELKAISYKEKDLSDFTTQVQFYRQNSATTSMIGIFSVNKIAHAVLESDGFVIDFENSAGIKEFNIADTDLSSGNTVIDPRYDSDGELIGKTLGMGISASADGVKKPIFELMNVNPQTSNVFNTMLRLGVPVNDACLFMAQPIIRRLIDNLNIARLESNRDISDIIERLKNELKKNIHSNTDNWNEPLSREDMIYRLRNEDPQTDYTVLTKYQQLLSMSDIIRNVTFPTRFNSINNSTGPRIIDNIITEDRIERFTYAGSEGGTGIVKLNEENNPSVVDINTVFDNHPILKAFARAYHVASDVFSDMPTNSDRFKACLSQNDTIKYRMFRNKKLYRNFGDFYLSYLVASSGFFDTSKERISYYINKFPLEFGRRYNEFKKKLAEYKESEGLIEESDQGFTTDNRLLAAIHLDYQRKTNRPFLTIDRNTLNENREMLSSAMTDLYKFDPDLAKDLLNYCFWRGGIGFSPKTFMALVPAAVKEMWTSSSNPELKYTDVLSNFGNIPISNETVMDQFVQNNYNDSSLVTYIGKKAFARSGAHVDEKSGLLVMEKDSDVRDRALKTGYIRVTLNGKERLWKLTDTQEDNGDSFTAFFNEMPMLGNNGFFIQIDTHKIDTKDAISLPAATVKPANADANLQSGILPVDADAASASNNTSKVNKQEILNTMGFVKMFNKNLKSMTNERALEALNENPETYIESIKQLFDTFEIKTDDLKTKEIIKEFEKFCK